jgi:hypothetical protein
MLPMTYFIVSQFGIVYHFARQATLATFRRADDDNESEKRDIPGIAWPRIKFSCAATRGTFSMESFHNFNFNLKFFFVLLGVGSVSHRIHSI